MSSRKKSKTAMKNRPFRSNSSSSTTNPFGSCGPLENDFLQFYADLYKSAVLFSDTDFQQHILYPPPNSHLPTARNVPKNVEESTSTIVASASDDNPLTLNGLRGNKSLRLSAIGGSSLRRKVSFSKHSPRRNLITPPVPQMAKMKLIPKITVQDNSSSCWSSDMDESDTTETEKASSTDDFDDDSDQNTPTKLEKDEPMQLPTIPHPQIGNFDTTG